MSGLEKRQEGQVSLVEKTTGGDLSGEQKQKLTAVIIFILSCIRLTFFTKHSMLSYYFVLFYRKYHLLLIYLQIKVDKKRLHIAHLSHTQQNVKDMFSHFTLKVIGVQWINIFSAR